MADKFILNNVIGELSPGAHIAVKRQAPPSFPDEVTPDGDGYYTHHGIYVKNPEGRDTVIHFWGERKSSAKVCSWDLEQFRSYGVDNELYEAQYKVRPLALQKTVEMAWKELSSPTKEWKYNLRTENCETFATYLKTGRGFSPQAQKSGWNILTWVSIGFAVVAVVCFLLFKLFKR